MTQANQLPSRASRRGGKKRSNSISSIADITSPAFRVFLLAFMAKLLALVIRQTVSVSVIMFPALCQTAVTISQDILLTYHDVAYRTNTLAA